MRKLFIAFTLVALIGAVSAQTASFSNTDINLDPGQNNSYGELTIEFEETPSTNTPQIFERDVEFGISAENETFENNVYTADIIADVPADTPPTEEPITRSADFEFDNRTPVNFEYFIRENSEIGISESNITAEQNVGDIGVEFAEVIFTQRFNTPETVAEYSFEGNITEVIESSQGSVDVRRFQETPLSLRTEIPENQQFGTYTGNMTVTDRYFSEKENPPSQYQQTIPVEITVDDNISPEITGTIFDDVQATQTADFHLTAEDNLEIDEVTAEITREESTENGTEMRDVGNYTFESTENLNEYTLEFEDTENLGTYEAFIEAEDTSGNRGNETVEFEVNRLNALNITNTALEFEPFGTEEESTLEMLQLNKSTPVELEMDFFNHDEQDSSIMIAVEDEEEDRVGEFDLDENNDTVTIEEPGTYSLVASSNMEETFSGRIIPRPIDQHVEVPEITVDGAIIEPLYPPEQEFQIGETEGELTYTETNSTVMDQIKFVGYTDAAKCEGHEQFTTCLTGYDLGEMNQVRNENQDLRQQRNSWRTYFWVLLGGTGIYLLAKRRWKNLPNYLYAYKTIDYS